MRKKWTPKICMQKISKSSSTPPTLKNESRFFFCIWDFACELHQQQKRVLKLFPLFSYFVCICSMHTVFENRLKCLIEFKIEFWRKNWKIRKFLEWKKMQWDFFGDFQTLCFKKLLSKNNKIVFSIKAWNNCSIHKSSQCHES